MQGLVARTIGARGDSAFCAVIFVRDHRLRHKHQSVAATATSSRTTAQQCSTECSTAHNGTEQLTIPDAARHIVRSNGHWPKRAEMLLVRSDGHSCSRELVSGSGRMTFAYPSTHQYLLMWQRKPQCVMVLKKLGPELFDEFKEVVNFLGQQHGMSVMVEPECYDQLSCLPGFEFVYTYTPDEQHRLGEYVDFVVCLGGDGVILHASYLFRNIMPPLISFNLGSLGFLTNHAFEEYEEALTDVILGSRRIESCTAEGEKGVMIGLRMRLLCEVYRNGCTVPHQQYEVLNDVVIDRGCAPYLANIECYEAGKLLTRVQADGVLLATPTGSTAYSVAAGGSMVHPNVPAILLTPICPHSLSFRPVVLPDYADIELKIPDNARTTAWVCFDGKMRQELPRGARVRVRMSPNPVPTINRMDQTGDWFGGLERCFGWNDRAPQKPLRI